MTVTARETHRPGPVTLVAAQSRHAVTEYWRARVVLVFSLVFPLVWLVFIGAVAGNEVADPATGLRVMQFATPLAVVMGTLYATLPTVAISVTDAREHGVLKRLQGTPLPSWAYLAGRAVGALVLAATSTALALLVAITAYDVQVVGRTAAATLATLTAALICFTTLGLAVSTLCRSSGTAEGVSIGSVVVLSFISGLYIPNGLPDVVTRVAGLFPVKPYAETLRAQFDPSGTGAGWDVGTLATLTAWTIAGALVATARLRSPEAATHGRRTRSQEATPEAPRLAAPKVTVGRPPTVLAMTAAQAAGAIRATARDPGAVIFAGAVPVGLFALLSSAMAASGSPEGGLGTVRSAAGMIAWGAAVTAFLNLPEAVVQARDRGVLKRLRGTPLPPVCVIAGRMAAALIVATVIAAAVLALGGVAFGLTLTPGRVAGALAVLALGTLTLAACGFLLAGAVTSARAFGAVGLVLLLPAAFVSDIFGVAGPAWMEAFGSALPLKHLQNAMVDVLSGGAPNPTHLAVLTVWGLLAALAAVRTFRWNTLA